MADWRDCDRCVENAEELRVVGPDHRNFSAESCPFCGHVTTEADFREEVAHMQAKHPDVIAERLTAAGFRLEDGKWVDLLANPDD